jgi:DeoR/GlpR family transcriptional regulator of sugar metabolism
MNSIPQISSTERQEQIQDLIRRDQRVSVNDLCRMFSVSVATARRDLEVLASQGLVQRVHGGAIAIRRAAPESPILERTCEQSEEKKQIGQIAAGLVHDGETLFLGSGTTVLEVARNLRNYRNLSVITNSLLVINVLSDVPQMTLISMGGMLRRSEMSFIGHITEQSLTEVRADKVIIGIRGLSLENGLTNDYLPETLTDRAILKMGGQVIIVADHTKCGTVSTAFVADLRSVHTLVTDQATDQEFVDALSLQGVNVIRA